MDKVYHFHSQSNQNSHLKFMNQEKAGFYSEEEDTNASGLRQQQNAKKSQFQQSKVPEEQKNNIQPKTQQNKLELRQKHISMIESDAGQRRQIQQKKEIDNHPYRHLIFSDYIDEESFKKHLILTYRGLVYSKKCLKGPSDKFIQTKMVNVKEARNPKGRTLLLDLDETLIHSCGLKENPDYVINAYENGLNSYQIGFRVRPYCKEFLETMTLYWDIYVFTASSPSYASAIVKFLDPEGKHINGILNRTNCMETKNGFFIKDLRIVKGKDLKKMIIVDNLAHSFGFQIENGIPILEWFQDKNDQELKNLIPYLIEASQVNDVRVFNTERLKLSQLAETNFEQL